MSTNSTNIFGIIDVNFLTISILAINFSLLLN